MATYGNNRRKRTKRENQWLQAHIAEYQDNGEVSEPSGGQFYVIDAFIGEKPPWLNLAQAMQPCSSLEDAMY